MLEAFIIGFWKVLAWPAFGYMLIGIAIGFWVGLLPGIGGLVDFGADAAVLLQYQRSVSAFAFLLGMLAVTGTTGDLTSILFGIPGRGPQPP
jgi:TctA family transporter